MIITVGGGVASGKSTLARNLSDRLGLKHVSAGSIMRKMASEKGMDILEFSKIAENDPEIDKLIDERQRIEAKGDCVVDGRLSRFFLDPDFSIWLTVPLDEKARRIIQRGEEYSDINAALKAVKERESSEIKRYKDYYDIDLSDTSSYDLVIDTGKHGIDEMTDLACDAVKRLSKN